MYYSKLYFIRTYLEVSTRTGKMGQHFTVREKSGYFTQNAGINKLKICKNEIFSFFLSFFCGNRGSHLFLDEPFWISSTWTASRIELPTLRSEKMRIFFGYLRKNICSIALLTILVVTETYILDIVVSKRVLCSRFGRISG